MYSILPAMVSFIFLVYGLYVVFTKGLKPITVSFFSLCITSAVWQGMSAITYQVSDPATARFFITCGYLLILFLPTSIYHFLTEVSEQVNERRYVYLSYFVAAIFAVFLLSTDLVINGYRQYFWGFYPKAGLLHPLHVLQTFLVVCRGLYITIRTQRTVPPSKRKRLRFCIIAVFVYFAAAIDFLCNYGVEFYPPGVLFIVVSLGIMAIGIVRHDLLNPMAVASSVAHEMRTPLASIRMLAREIDHYLPELLEGYLLAAKHGLLHPTIQPLEMSQLSQAGASITHEIDRTSNVLDMMLASIKMKELDTSSFTHHSIKDCIAQALDRYSFEEHQRERIVVAAREDFNFYGSDLLLVMVLFNLLKNSLYALKAGGKGHIHISLARAGNFNLLYFSDTGSGVSQEVLPQIFEEFYTTKKSAGSGLGLAFCRRAMTAFGGDIRCESVEGEHTTFTLAFPIVGNKTLPPAPEKAGRSRKSAATLPSNRA